MLIISIWYTCTWLLCYEVDIHAINSYIRTASSVKMRVRLIIDRGACFADPKWKKYLLRNPK